MTNSQSKKMTNNLTDNRCDCESDDEYSITDSGCDNIGSGCGQTYHDTYVVDIRCEAFGIKSQQITYTIEKAQELVEELKKVWATNQYYSGQGKFSNELFSIKILCISGSDKSVNVVSTWEKYIKVQNKE